MTTEQISEVIQATPQERADVIQALLHKGWRRQIVAILSSRQFLESLPVRHPIHLGQKSTHYLIPRSRGGTSHKVNQMKMNVSVHEAFHTVFRNRTPPEQLAWLLDLNASVIQSGIQDEIRDILEHTKPYVASVIDHTVPHPNRSGCNQLFDLLIQDNRRAIVDLVLSDRFLEHSTPHDPEPLRQKSKHHLVPRSRRGSERSLNIYPWIASTHAEFHVLFDNRTPSEQLECLLDMNGPVLQPAFREGIRRQVHQRDFYVLDAFRSPEEEALFMQRKMTRK